MSLRSILGGLLGRPLANSEEKSESLSVMTGVPVLGLDALASTGYGPEAALTVLLPLGVLGLRYMPFIVLAVVLELTMLYLSYQQTAAAYPDGGGAYIVAKDNLGIRVGVAAAVALLLDYMLNVSVGIAAGVGAIVSAIPALQPYTLPICLLILATLTVINLRGVKESGLTFVVPVCIFILCMGGTIAWGVIRALQSGGHPAPAVPPPALPNATAALSIWMLLTSFANGCTAMTGVEAVSNGIPLFRDPRVRNARITLTVIVGILALFLLGIGYLAPAYKIHGMNEQEPGYQTVLSQLVAAVAGRGPFYYVAIGSIFIVLTYSAQTSFADFPRVCRLLAEDGYLPHTFANRGRRLVYSSGIILLALISGVILAVFGGITEKLIPLFAVGAFTAFLLSQVGMVRHWLRKRGRAYRIKLFFNGLGACTTGIALAIIIAAKFVEGAWIVIVVAPTLYLLMTAIRRHYKKIEREIEQPVKLRPNRLEPMAVVIPIMGWNRVSERALRYSFDISDDITAVHITTEKEDDDHLRKLWEEKVVRPARKAGFPIPRLEIIYSPYRQIFQPLLDFIDKLKKEKPGRLIGVIIPELVEPHWYEYLLHNLRSSTLRAFLHMKRDRDIVVINTPWYLRE